MNATTGHGPQPEESEIWEQALDFVERTATLLGLSGWSLGICAGDTIGTHSRGFAAETCARYASLSLDAQLPGPATVRERRNQYFPTGHDAHDQYPDSSDIDRGTRHDAAATLVLWREGDHRALGYLALHFSAPRSFDEHERGQLERLAATIAVTIPRQHGMLTT